MVKEEIFNRILRLKARILTHEKVNPFISQIKRDLMVNIMK